MNPLYQMMARGASCNPIMNFMQQFQQFRNSFQGNPQQMVQQLLQSGKISQSDYNRAVETVRQMQGMFKQ